MYLSHYSKHWIKIGYLKLHLNWYTENMWFNPRTEVLTFDNRAKEDFLAVVIVL